MNLTNPNPDIEDRCLQVIIQIWSIPWVQKSEAAQVIAREQHTTIAPHRTVIIILTVFCHFAAQSACGSIHRLLASPLVWNRRQLRRLLAVLLLIDHHCLLMSSSQPKNEDRRVPGCFFTGSKPWNNRQFFLKTHKYLRRRRGMRTYFLCLLAACHPGLKVQCWKMLQC